MKYKSAISLWWLGLEGLCGVDRICGVSHVEYML